MVLGHRSRQRGFADVDQWEAHIPARSFWAHIRQWSETALHDEDFEAWYAPIGRPSIPPSFIVALTVIQLRQGWSDREAVEAAFFDDRVKYALGLSRTPEIRCDRSTWCKYRARLLQTDCDRQLLQHSLEVAAAAGLLQAEGDVVDSFMVAGAAARQGTWTLIRRAIHQVLRQAAAEGLPRPTLARSESAIMSNRSNAAISLNPVNWTAFVGHASSHIPQKMQRMRSTS